MDDEKLIEYIKQYPLLYDPNDKRYCDNQRKDAVWREIGKNMKCNENDCKKAWTLLRDCFRRAIKKKNLVNGQAPSIAKKWKYEDEMSFLLPHLREKTSSNSSRAFEESNDMEILKQEISVSPVDEASVPSLESITLYGNSSSTSKRRSPTPTPAHTPAKRRLTGEGTASSVLMKYILDSKERSDDVDQFFAGISTTVKSFPPRDRAIAKAKMFQVVSEMEIEILSRPSASSGPRSPMPAMSPYFDENFP